MKASDNVFPKLLVSEEAAPATPDADTVVVYAKSDGLVYAKDDGGTETLLSGGDSATVAAGLIATHAADADAHHDEDHAARHADGGADELAVEGLPTAEMDDTLVLAPDGAGGVEFRAEAAAAALDDLTDVDAPAPDDGDALTWDDYQQLWVPGTVATGDVALDDLTDVDAPAPNDGEVLTWDDYQQLWVAAAAAAGASALDDLTDVDVPAPDDGDVLAWNDYQQLWVATAPGGGAADLGDLGDVTVSGSETDGQVLTSDGAGGFAFEDPTSGGAGSALWVQDIDDPLTSIANLTTGLGTWSLDGTAKVIGVTNPCRAYHDTALSQATIAMVEVEFEWPASIANPSNFVVGFGDVADINDTGSGKPNLMGGVSYSGTANAYIEQDNNTGFGGPAITTPTPGDWVKIRLLRAGNIASVWVDDVHLHDAQVHMDTDENPAATLQAYVKVYGVNTLHLRNFKAWSLNADPTATAGGGGDGVLTTALGVVLDAPEADDQVDIVVPFDCTITGVTLLADQSGDIVVDIWNDTYGNAPPTDADSITASAPPTLSTAAKSQDTTLTGWTTSLTAGTVLRFNVDSVATVTRVTLVLHVQATSQVLLSSGTSFPGSPSVGDRYRRTDLDYQVYRWDGTYWLGPRQRWYAPYESNSSSGSNLVLGRMPISGDILVKRAVQTLYCTTLPTLANHWNISVRALDGGSTTELTQLSTDEVTPEPNGTSQWNTFTFDDIDVLVDYSTPYPGVEFATVETGSADAYYPIFYVDYYEVAV